MANKNYEYHALGSYKNELFQLIMKHELSEFLIDILMPSIEDNRFDKIDNFIGGLFEYHGSDGIERVNLKSHLFDVPFIYSTVTDTRNVICIDTNISRCGNTLKEMSVVIEIMAHKNSLQLDSETRMKYKKLGYIGRNRIDIAVAILGDILNGSKDFGIGKLVPTPSVPTQSYFPNNDFWGKILRYSCTDFMKDFTKYEQ